MKSLVYILLFANLSLVSFSQQKKIDVTYIANCGFLIGINDNQVLIDALFKEGFGEYLVTPDSITKRIMNGQGLFSNVHLMLITHNHQDHFNDSMVVKYLNHDIRNKLIAPRSVIDMIKKYPDYIERTQLIEANSMHKDSSLKKITIEAFQLQHDNRPEIENVGYLIEIDGVKVFHTGDYNCTNAIQLKNLHLESQSIDVALLNYYGFWHTEGIRNFTVHTLNPKNIVLMHIPPKEIDSVKASVNKISNFIDITVFDKSMEEKTFNFNQN